MSGRLIDPLIEYSQFTRREEVQNLDNAFRKYRNQAKERTLAYFTGELENNRRQALEISNQMTREAVRLSIIGDLVRKNSLVESPEGRRWYEYHLIAARNYQKVFELSSRENAFAKDEALYIFLLMSSAEFHNAMQHSSAFSLCQEAKVMIKSLLKEKRDWFEENLYRFHLLLLDFFSDDYGQLSERIKLYQADLDAKLDGQMELSIYDLLDLQCLISITTCMADFSSYVTKGERDALEKCKAGLEFCREACDRSGRPDFRYAVDKLTSSIQTSSVLSVWNIGSQSGSNLSNADGLNEFIHSKVKNNMYFLFPSQYEALGHGFLDSDAKRVLLSTPTGAGKTFLAELTLLQEILKDWSDDSIAIYMVPSRALAREKFEDLRRTFSGLPTFNKRVCQVTGEILLDAKRAMEENDILVVTPEKFDMLMRNRFYGNNVKCLIIDEFHNMRSGYRGIRIEFDLIRFLELFPKSKTVLISAIVSNFDDVKKWFVADKDFETTWRPTFARIGIFDARANRIIRFTDGASYDVSLPIGMRNNAHQKQAAYLAKSFASEGATMIFCSNKFAVDYCARKILELADGDIRFNSDMNVQYATKLSRVIGEKEEIYEFFRAGIGVHRGDLPHIIRRIMEDAVRSNAINLLVSTTTLVEGVNLPLRTIIIPIPEVGGEPLPIGLFFNILGRAGRPGKEIEGQVIFVASRGKKAHTTEDLERYETATRKDIERIVTPLVRIIELKDKLENPGEVKMKQRHERELGMHEAVLDTMLLSALVEKLVQAISGDSLLNRIVVEGSVNLTPGSRRALLKILEDSEARLLDSKSVLKDSNKLTITGFGKMAYKTGFSPSTCRDLFEKMSEVINAMDQTNMKGRITNNSTVLYSILRHLEGLVEAGAYFSDGVPVEYVSILSDWIKGVSSSRLAEVYFRNSKNKMTETLLQVDGLLSGFSAWYTYALSLIMEFFLEEKGVPGSKYINYIRNLPRYCFYGSYDRLVLYILQRDTSKELFRDDILKFVSAFDRNTLYRIIGNPSLLDTTETTGRVNKIDLSLPDDFRQTLKRILAG